ncbi:unnamed protein product [Rhizoctonia solani]|uniref:BTB domain-containing protein n=1 Tax=Rhizoctonia solani TaxID=456999 RepID=A0A8H2ZZE8_9AGAM|nr:unnamed protein product [Rhizoctonia solani]
MQPRTKSSGGATPSWSRPVSMAFSTIEHDPTSSNNWAGPNQSRNSAIIGEENLAPVVLGVVSEFAYADGNIELQVSTNKFWVHEFQLTKFIKFAELIRQARDQGEITSDSERRVMVNITCTGKLGPKDFRHTLRVIYSSFVSGRVPPSFDAVTLISTLRVSTLYQNPDLRNFSISQLQSRFVLSPIYRIALSDELSIPDWESPAFIELCRRSEPLTQKEAEQRHQYISLVHQATTDPFLTVDGNLKKDKLQVAADQTLKHTSLPACDCRAQIDNLNNSASAWTWFGATEVNYNCRQSSIHGSSVPNTTPGTFSVIRCEIHRLAPPIVSESRQLYKHLSGALGKLAVLKQKVSSKARGLPGGDKEYLIEREIKKANWVCRAEER